MSTALSHGRQKIDEGDVVITNTFVVALYALGVAVFVILGIGCVAWGVSYASDAVRENKPAPFASSVAAARSATRPSQPVTGSDGAREISRSAAANDSVQSSSSASGASDSPAAGSSRGLSDSVGKGPGETEVSRADGAMGNDSRSATQTAGVTNRGALLVGTWKDENSQLTYGSDGTYSVKWDLGSESTGEWAVDGNRLSVTTTHHREPGAAWTTERATEIDDLLSLTQDEYRARSPNGTVWTGRRMSQAQMAADPVAALTPMSVPATQSGDAKPASVATQGIAAATDANASTPSARPRDSKAATLLVTLPLIGVCFLVIAGLCFVSYRVQSPGIVVSPRRNLIEFPGGGIAANSAADYVRWSWFTQSYRRYHAPLDEIIAIDGSTWTTTTVENNKMSSSTAFDMQVTFPFGVVTFGFGGNQAKRDQLYNVLRYALRMGTPVFEA